MSNIDKITTKEGFYPIKEGVEAYVYERESRKYSQTGEPWIIKGGKTIYAEISTATGTRTVNFTYDGEGDLPGIYKTKREALKALKAHLKQSFK